MLTERRVLVTGGVGFIGSNLCTRLLERGNEVLCVDNFYTGRRRNIQHLLRTHCLSLSRHDICFPLYVEVDQIFNLACPASPVHYQFDPVQTTKVSDLPPVQPPHYLIEREMNGQSTANEMPTILVNRMRTFVDQRQRTCAKSLKSGGPERLDMTLQIR